MADVMIGQEDANPDDRAALAVGTEAGAADPEIARSAIRRRHRCTVHRHWTPVPQFEGHVIVSIPSVAVGPWTERVVLTDGQGNEHADTGS